MENHTTIPEGFKRCTRCSEIKPRSEFSAHSGRYDGLYNWCKPCANEYNRRYAKAHADDIRERKRLYRAKHIEIENEYRRCYYAQFPEKIREKGRRYRAGHPEKARSRNRNRRGRQANLPSAFTSEDETRALEYWHGRCAVCEKPLRDLFGEHIPTMDHWIALSDPNCPGTIPENMIPLCSKCNLTKFNRDPREWLIAKFGKRKAAQIIRRIETFFEWVRTQSR